ncbi:MAG: hypothetical protein ACREAA_19125 [Candidatus Polarisedimenticolia bacterium]
MSRQTVVRGPVFLCALLLILMGPALSFAGPRDLRYGFVEGGWLREDLEVSDSENGWFGGASFGLRSFHFFGEYRDPGDFESWEAGAGWHGLFGPKFDLVLEAAFVDTDLFDDGYRASGGFRWMLLENLEVNAYYHHLDVGDFENDAVSAGANWNFAGRMALGGEWTFGDEADTGRVFVRFYFQKD